MIGNIKRNITWSSEKITPNEIKKERTLKCYCNKMRGEAGTSETRTRETGAPLHVLLVSSKSSCGVLSSQQNRGQYHMTWCVMLYTPSHLSFCIPSCRISERTSPDVIQHDVSGVSHFDLIWVNIMNICRAVNCMRTECDYLIAHEWLKRGSTKTTPWASGWLIPTDSTLVIKLKHDWRS